MKSFDQVVSHLESLSIMPKEMPGIEKIKSALSETDWFKNIDPKKVIVVAGTNGKGSTCAILESLLTTAGCQVGFYSSPHLIDTTERIRVNKKQISKANFVELYERNEALIAKHQLTHFEALTVMAADFFFFENKLDYAIFEVGLGGTFDATNAIPHATSVITALALDHTNILGNTIEEIAKNKFGIVKTHNLVVHHPLPEEVASLKHQVQKQTESCWAEAKPVSLEILKTSTQPVYNLKTNWGITPLSLLGSRAAQNAATALTVFEALGFDPSKYLKALSEVSWPGRMQKIEWPNLSSALYLSGDHNLQGMNSLLEILKDFSYKNIYVIVGIGKDKDSTSMLDLLLNLKNLKLYLTETPFKGLALSEYPERYSLKAEAKSVNIELLLKDISQKATPEDLVLVTGSLYLVGKVLGLLSEVATNK